MAGQPLDGKVAIVTGSSRGIGKSVALKLAEDGADIVVSARTEDPGELPGAIGETASAVTAMGRKALAVRADLANDADLTRLVETSLKFFGHIDILINNAVIVGPRRQFVGGTPEFLDLAYRVNIRAPYVLAQQVSQCMAEAGGGVIINITSGAAMGAAHRSPDELRRAALDAMDPSYGITKAALDRMTTAYAAELLQSNIAIVSVSPGLVITERIRHAAIRPNVDFSRAEPPEVIANAVAFLCQRGAEYAGQILRARDMVGPAST
jgi:NAD(P)-dependent dehydrogenase (short-subunit alcohol dehydrogenase family)